MMDLLKSLFKTPEPEVVIRPKSKPLGVFGKQCSSRIKRGLPVGFPDIKPPKKGDCSHASRYRTHLKVDGVRYKVACRACGKVVVLKRLPKKAA